MKKKTVLKLLFITSCLVAMSLLLLAGFSSCVACFTIMKQAHWTVWHFRMLKHWPKAKMMMMPIAMVMVQSIAEATK